MDLKPISRKRVVKKPANGPHMTVEGLYYAHHRGKAIWKNDGEEVLRLEYSHCIDHIASPDVHLDEGIMFYHGLRRRKAFGHSQQTFVYDFDNAQSYGPVTPYYLRAWKYGDTWFGVAHHRGLSLYKTGNPFIPWKKIAHLSYNVRHAFVYHDWCYYTNIGDQPERIFRRRLNMSTLKLEEEIQEVLRPKRDWEGVHLDIVPSKRGYAKDPKHELRDPMVYKNRLYYSYAGEQGIAYAEFPEGVL